MEKALGVSMDTLPRIQVWHDSYFARRADEIDAKRFTPA
jgi:hypothetical protein